MHTYLAYSVAIDSEIALPELTKRSGGYGELLISLDKLPRIFDDSGGKSYQSKLCSDGVYLHWAQIGTFFLDSKGSKVLATPFDDADDDYVRLALTGPVLAIAMHLRGNLVLHAAAVEIAGRVCLFIGPSGSGKSTLLASLLSRGHKLICDDTAVFSFGPSEDDITLHPGVPRIKLWPDAADSSGYESKESKPIYEGIDKLSLSCKPEDIVTETRSKIDRIYWLRGGTELEISLVNAGKAPLALVSNSYVEMMDQTLARPRAASELDQCGKLAEHSRVCLLTRPADLTRLQDVCKMIEIDLAASDNAGE
jgi:hypothetical protein